MINRRTLLTLIAAAAAPARGSAQRAGPLPLVGFIHVAAPGPLALVVDAYRKGLSEAGFAEGRNVALAFRWAEGHHERLADFARNLVAQGAAVIIAGGGQPAAIAAKSVTSTVPILFIAADPVEGGLVASLARPGGNLTGISLQTNELAVKRLELLLELVPKAASVAVLFDPNSAQFQATVDELARRLQTAGKREHRHAAGTAEAIDQAFAAMTTQRPDALLVTTSALFTGRREQIIAQVSRLGLPASYELREWPASGGLMSYGPSLSGVYAQLGALTGRVLRGEQPRDLPVQQPTRFEFVVNLKTLQTLGLTVPETLRLRIDEVLE